MKELYSRQLGFMLFLYILGSALIFTPESIIGQDLWVATILGSLVGLLLLHITVVIQGLYPGKDIMQIAELTLGKILGKIFNLIFLWLLLILAILLLFDAMVFLQIIYITTPEILLATLIMLASAFVIYPGIAVGGRLADLFILPVILLIALGFVTSFTLFNYSNITPILANIKPVLGAGLVSASWPFSEVIILAVFFPFVADFDRNKKQIYIWYGLASITLIIRSLLILGVLGYKGLELARFPLYDVFRLIEYQDFQRLELFFFLLFIMTLTAAILALHKVLILNLEHMFALKNSRSLIIPVGFLILALMYDSFPSDIEFLASQASSTIFLTLPPAILYITVIFIAAKIKHRKSPHP
ncbi:MAG TPA: endospore germination permease [Syntrophomonadaceae bacterium]|nr:endospore germination permease [Syntrophomonadaceae bacterium]